MPRAATTSDAMPPLVPHLDFLDEVTSHCSRRAQEGKQGSGYSAHPSPMVRWAVDLGRREGLAIIAERIRLTMRRSLSRAPVSGRP